MRTRVHAFVGLAAALCPVCAASGEIILLNDGQTVRAPILREYPDRVLVDLGYDIVAIPRKDIRSIESEEVAATAREGVQTTADLFSTAELPSQSVKVLTERFGEGVLLVSSPNALGSGFFISNDGHLLTNFHVVEAETKLAVTVFSKVGDEFKRLKFEDVDIVATNSFLDLALLRANLPKDYKPVITYLAREDALRDGDVVFAIGNPLGLERSVSQGIVSRRNRAEEGLAFVQTTTQINPGNSGGPLFNTRGEVVGVTNMKISGGEGLGFAIPIRYAIDFLRNRDAFAYNSESSTAGFRYLQPAARQKAEPPPFLKPGQ